MTVHAPDDDLDERWRAGHEHPRLAAVPDFLALDLGEKAHANDQPAAHQSPHAQPYVDHHVDAASADPDQLEVRWLSADNLKPAQSLSDEEKGAAMLQEEYQSWLGHRDSTIEIDTDHEGVDGFS